MAQSFRVSGVSGYQGGNTTLAGSMGWLRSLCQGRCVPISVRWAKNGWPALRMPPVVAEVDLILGKREVQIDLRGIPAAQGRKITGIAKQLRQRLYTRRQRPLVGRAMLLATGGIRLIPVINDEHPVEQTGALVKQLLSRRPSAAR